MMTKGNNQRRVHGAAEDYSRTEWGIYLDMTVSDIASYSGSGRR
jgi:hypothetical protein